MENTLVYRWVKHPRLRHIPVTGLPGYIIRSMLEITEYYKDFDSSHDEAHGIRVLYLAWTIYQNMRKRDPLFHLHPIRSEADCIKILDLACVYHDFFDGKYFRTPEACAARKQLLIELLVKHASISSEDAATVVTIADSSSYSKLIWENGTCRPPYIGMFQNTLLVMADADRLDAIIGWTSVDRSAQFQLYRLRWLLAEGRNDENAAQYDKYAKGLVNPDTPALYRRAWELAILYTLEDAPGSRSSRASAVFTPVGKEIAQNGAADAINRAKSLERDLASNIIPDLE